jgi:ribonuclease R
MSGLVALSTMEDDFYIFEPARNHLIGRRNRRIIRLGDKVEVQVAKVNTFKKQVDFRLTQTGQARPTQANRGRNQPQRTYRRGTPAASRGRSPAPRPTVNKRAPIPSSHHRPNRSGGQKRPSHSGGRR